MTDYLGFGTEKKSFELLKQFINSPVSFYEKSSHDHDTLLNFMAFITRVSALISFAINVVIPGLPIIEGVVTFAFVVFLAKILVMIGLFIGSRILNFFVRIIIKKDDIMAAERALAFASVGSLLSPLPFIGIVAGLVNFVLEIIGVSKQYKVGYGKAAIAIFAPAIIIFLIGFMLIAAAFGGVPSSPIF